MKIFKIIIALTLLSISISSCTKEDIKTLPNKEEIMLSRQTADDGMKENPKDSEE